MALHYVRSPNTMILTVCWVGLPFEGGSYFWRRDVAIIRDAAFILTNMVYNKFEIMLVVRTESITLVIAKRFSKWYESPLVYLGVCCLDV